MNSKYYKKNEISFLFWNVLADVYIKYYDKKYSNLKTYDSEHLLKPLELNYNLRQSRILAHINMLKPSIIGLIEIQEDTYQYLANNLSNNYFFSEIYCDELDQDKKDYNFPKEGKCVMWKKELNLTGIDIKCINSAFGRKILDFNFKYLGKKIHYIVHHNSPVYMYSVDKNGEYLNPEFHKYDNIYNDSDSELNQIVEIHPGIYKKFIRGGAIACLEGLVEYINNNIDDKSIVFIGGDFNSQPSYPKVKKSHIPEYIDKIKFNLDDLHSYKIDKTFFSLRHDGRRLDYIFYDKTKVISKYIKPITPPCYKNLITNYNNKDIRRLNYNYQVMHYGSDHQPIFGIFLI